MSDGSNIEWTDATWPVVVGCTKKSTGCSNCCAIRDAVRLGGNPNPKIGPIYKGLVQRQANGILNWTGEVRCVEERLTIPLHYKKPRRIFVPYMGDIFHPGVPDEFLDKIFAVMALTPRHSYQVLTKDAERMQSYISAISRNPMKRLACDIAEKAGFYAAQAGIPRSSAADFARRLDPDNGGWPLPNVWLGVSCEDQRAADERIPLLLDTPAAVRFVSAEPLLGPVDLDGYLYNRYHMGGARHMYNQLDWVIVGGESGPGARPMHPDWARSLRDQCRASGVSYFHKQNGEWLPVIQTGLDLEDSQTIHYVQTSLAKTPATPQRAAFHDFKDGQRMIRVGKKAAGRLLDGREWNEFPKQENHHA